MRERTSEANTTHGKSGTRVHRIWKNAIQRCCSPQNPAYQFYGARGITICDEWKNDFAAFYAYMGEPPSKKHSINRKDNDKGYEPGNVEWSTLREQLDNRSCTILVTFNGTKISLGKLCEEQGVNYGMAHYYIVMRKRSVEEIVAMLKSKNAIEKCSPPDKTTESTEVNLVVKN
jgi:hypothetical protein